MAKEKVWKVFNHPWLSPPRVSLGRGIKTTLGYSGESEASEVVFVAVDIVWKRLVTRDKG
jgi:hypothetical protein